MNKAQLRGVNKSSKDILKEKQIGKPKNIEKLTIGNDIKPKDEWLEDTKMYFNIIVNELNLLGVLYEIDTMQFYTAFELYDEAMKLKNSINPGDEDHIKKLRAYRELLNECFKMLKDYFVSPASRMKAALELQELEKKEDKNKAAIDLLKE